MKKIKGALFALTLISSLSGCESKSEVEFSSNILFSINYGGGGFGTRADTASAEIMIYTDKSVEIYMISADYTTDVLIGSFDLTDDDYDDLKKLVNRDKLCNLDVKEDHDVCDGSSSYITLYDTNDDKLVKKGGYMPSSSKFLKMYNGVHEILETYNIEEIIEKHRDTLREHNESLSENPLDDFSFSLTWGVYGISSYDSTSGELIKTKDATNPDDYITTYNMSNEELQIIYELIEDLDVQSYPDDYNPYITGSSEPSMTIILSVHTKDYDKTITAKDISLSYEANNLKGQNFLDTVDAISNMLVNTDEWNQLPDYEFYYD